MRPIWKFSRPKGPGFGISANMYLTVLAARAALPTLRIVIDPKGEQGAVQGFGVPLAKSSTREDLDRPLARGEYGLASPDRKTVVRMRVLSKEEVGFDPAPFLRSKIAEGASDELKARVSATWTLMQLTLETHDAEVYPALRFLGELSRRLGELTEGVVADPISQRYRLPHEVLPGTDQGASASEHVVVHAAGRDAFTLGLQKFALPELEIKDVPEGLDGPASKLLLGLAQRALNGEALEVGARVGGKSALLELAPGGLDRGRWEGIACLEIIPTRGRTLADGLAEMA